MLPRFCAISITECFLQFCNAKPFCRSVIVSLPNYACKKKCKTTGIQKRFDCYMVCVSVKHCIANKSVLPLRSLFISGRPDVLSTNRISSKIAAPVGEQQVFFHGETKENKS